MITKTFRIALDSTADFRRYCQRCQRELQLIGIRATSRVPAQLELSADLDLGDRPLEELYLIVARKMQELKTLPVRATFDPIAFSEERGTLYLPVRGTAIRRVFDELNAELQFLGIFGNLSLPYGPKVLLAEEVSKPHMLEAINLLTDIGQFSGEIESEAVLIYEDNGNYCQAVFRMDAWPAEA